MMLDEFPALGRLDFFETALAFMAGYGIRAYLIAQSLNQISKAYGENNAILDNCHVRIAFSSNDERTAKRISDALGTATELRAQRNYAGHRLAPWLSHVMVSRQETARPLLTPGEVMQLPASDELVLVSGLPPIRAKKLRYYEDSNFTARVAAAPPPVPRVTTISMRSVRARRRSSVGPQANSMWRGRSTTRVHSPGKGKFGWLRHQRLPAAASVNFTSSVFTGASALIQNEISKLAGKAIGKVRAAKA